MDQLGGVEKVDVPELLVSTVKALRRQRMGMVQTKVVPSLRFVSCSCCAARDVTALILLFPQSQFDFCMRAVLAFLLASEE